MDINEVKKSVHEYVFENTFTESEKITETSLIFKEGFLDSMGLIMLITFLEEKFEVKVTDADMVEENFESIISISEFVTKKSA